MKKSNSDTSNAGSRLLFGGGTYGASYANYVGNDHVICPVGK